MDFVKSILDRINVTMSELNEIKEKLSLYILEQEKTKDFDFFDTQHEEEVASHHEEEVSQHDEEVVSQHEEEVVSQHEEEEVVSQHDEEEVASHHEEEVASQHEEEEVVSQHEEVVSQHEEEYVKEEVNTKNVYNSSYSNLTSSQFTKTNKSSINNNPPQRNYRNFW